MKKRLKRVEFEIKDKSGRVIGFNLAASEASDDWIRAGRLLNEGKLSELEAMDARPMYYRPDDLVPNVKKKGSKNSRKKQG
jgi:hypothetical protein